jgi:hypothetical protein
MWETGYILVGPAQLSALLDFLELKQTIKCDFYIATLTKLTGRISSVRPEEKTTFLLQRNNTRLEDHYCSAITQGSKTTLHIAKFDRTDLPHPQYNPPANTIC